jgi:hypothetical protein
MPAWLRLSIGFVVLGHGIAYLPYGFFPGQVVTAWKGSSELLGGVLTPERVHAAVPVLFVTAGAAMISVALAIALAPWVPGWWRPLAIVGSVAGIAGFAVFWDGQGQLLVQEGVIGLALSLILLTFAVVVPNAFR